MGVCEVIVEVVTIKYIRFTKVIWLVERILTPGDLGGGIRPLPPKDYPHRNWFKGSQGPVSYENSHCKTFAKEPMCVSLGILMYKQVLDQSLFEVEQNKNSDNK